VGYLHGCILPSSVKYHDSYYNALSIGAIINFNDDTDTEELFAAKLQSDGFVMAIFTDASLAVDKIMSRT
jgi:hypothetical protein